MDVEVCSQCGKEIDGQGVRFRDRVFCSDACCDVFEEELTAKDELDMEDLDEMENLDEGELAPSAQEDLGYRDESGIEEFDEDDFTIDPDDF